MPQPYNGRDAYYCPDCGEESLEVTDASAPDPNGEFSETCSCPMCHNVIFLSRSTTSSEISEKLPDRIRTLKKLSGLDVRVRKEKVRNAYDFSRDGQTIKSCFTYKKAKLFAEGISYLRKSLFKGSKNV